MRPSTGQLPKSLLPVHGKPFVDLQLTWLKTEGFTDAVYCIGHLGEMLRDHVGDGSRWGIRVAYADEGEQRLGTAGALRYALDLGLLVPVFAVLYGDSYLSISIDSMWKRYEQSAAPALMTVLRNDGKWDASNVIYDAGRVLLYDKSAHAKPEAMKYIDYGISILTRNLIEQRIPPGKASDLAPVLNALSLEGKLAGFEATERFYEIGSPEGLRDLETFLTPPQSPAVKSQGKGRTGILGGGLAGLTVAAHLEADSEVLEGGSRPGGHCQSVVEQGFTYDAGGPHIIFSRNQQTLDFMESLLGDNVYRGRRANKIFYKGRYVKYPFENGLYDLEPQDRFECLYHYIQNDHPAPTNFKEWIYRTFGTGLAEKYLVPYNEKIWKVPAEQMSMDWVEGRVPKPPVEDVIKAAVGVETEGYTHQLHFYYPGTGGVEEIPKAMAKRVRHITPEFGVHHVRKTRDGWLVSDGSAERVYERVVSTLPIVEMASIFEGVPREIKDCVGALRHNSLFTVTIGLASERLPEYTAIYVPASGTHFSPAFVSCPCSARKTFPRGNRWCRPKSPRIQAMASGNSVTSDVLRKVIAGLESMDLIRPGEICYTNVIRTKYGYVVQDFTYRKYLDQAKNYFEGEGVALCGRNAEFEYINMDQCIERGIDVAASSESATFRELIEETTCPRSRSR